MEQTDAQPPSPLHDSFINQGPVGVAVQLAFDVSAEDLERLWRDPTLRQGLPTTAKPRRLKSTYLDTRDHAFGRAGFSFRLSNEAGRLVRSIEAPRQGVLQRFEQQQTTSSDDETTIADRLLARLGGSHLPTALQPMFDCEILRRSWRIGGVKISLDAGRITAGDKTAPFHMVVLDLKRGNHATLFAVARRVLALVPADLAVRSVAQYGYQLLAGGDIAPVRTTTIALVPAMSAAEGTAAVFNACLAQLLANRSGVSAGRSDSLHAMRVAARRLDAAIRVFSSILSADETSAIARELKWISGELGKARELDVFLVEAVEPLLTTYPRRKSVATLHRTVARQRRTAYGRVKAALASDRFRIFALRAAEWADGRCLDDSAHKALQEETTKSVVAAQLSRQKRKMRSGERLAELDPGQRHKLRLRAKRLRYAIELTRGLFDGPDHAP